MLSRGSLFRVIHFGRTRNPARIKAIVGLRLLEVIRDYDLPAELLEQEDPTQTIPRRLGLNDVVERQIRAYEHDEKKRVHLTDRGAVALFNLVSRRPDSDQVFFQTGLDLAEVPQLFRYGKVFPKSVQYLLARVYLGQRLKKLFGRQVIVLGEGFFSPESKDLFFREVDREGNICCFISGMCQGVLEQIGQAAVEVEHSLCQAHGDDRCMWNGKILSVTES